MKSDISQFSADLIIRFEMMAILLKAGLRREQNSMNKNLNTNLVTNATIKFYLRIFLFLLNWWTLYYRVN